MWIRSGGDRKKHDQDSHLVDIFQHTVKADVAGMPQDETTCWVGLHPGQVSHKMPVYSVRVGIGWRALGIRQGNDML